MEKDKISRRHLEKQPLAINLSLRNTSDAEIVEYYLECHGPGFQKHEETIDQWIQRMLDLLGPDDCKFLIRNVMPSLSGMWMADGQHLYVPKISQASRYSWCQVATKCTNHPKLEAVRIINENEAIDSKGIVIKLEKYKPIEELFDEEISRAESEGLPVVAEEPPLDDHGPGEQIDTSAAPISLYSPFCSED